VTLETQPPEPGKKFAKRIDENYFLVPAAVSPKSHYISATRRHSHRYPGTQPDSI